jgi:hypothetical protein
MGENFQTDLGGLSGYRMISAYSRNDTPGSSTPLATNKLPSFVYMNYDLSSCDVFSITLAADIQVEEIVLAAQVTASVCSLDDLNLFIMLIPATDSH